MASNGSFQNIYSSTNNLKFSLGWHTIERSLENNTTTIGIWTVLEPLTNMFNLSCAYSITVGPQTQRNTIMCGSNGQVQAGASYMLFGTDSYINHKIAPIVVPHNADGTKNLNISFVLDFGIVGGEVRYSTTVELDPIDRLSTITASNGVIGSKQVSITITTPVAGRAHKLTYTFGNLKGNIATNTTSTSLKWTLPSSFYNQMPEEKSKTGTITLSYILGSTTYTATCNFIASVDPDICGPLITPTVINISDSHVALTGSRDILIRYESMVEYAVGATAQNGAYLVSQSITCGSKTISDMAQGVIDDVPDGTFVFRAVDSRGYASEKTLTKTVIDYIKPTCNQEVKTELVDETKTKVYIKIYGSIFDDSFGAVENTMTIQIRHTDDNGVWSEWSSLPDFVGDNINDNTYLIELSGGDFDYNKNYLVQSRIIDKLYTVESSTYSIRVKPVFDWGKEDFNLNVPFHMNNQTIIRHNSTANNVVLSASGGHIYLRPGGTNNTSGEVRITSQGNIEITGDIIVDGVNIITALKNKGII